MAGFVTGIIQNAATGAITYAVTTGGRVVGDMVIGAGDLIEGGGRNIGNGIEGFIDKYGNWINTYGDAAIAATAPSYTTNTTTTTTTALTPKRRASTSTALPKAPTTAPVKKALPPATAAKLPYSAPANASSYLGSGFNGAGKTVAKAGKAVPGLPGAGSGSGSGSGKVLALPAPPSAGETKMSVRGGGGGDDKKEQPAKRRAAAKRQTPVPGTVPGTGTGTGTGTGGSGIPIGGKKAPPASLGAKKTAATSTPKPKTTPAPTPTPTGKPTYPGPSGKTATKPRAGAVEKAAGEPAFYPGTTTPVGRGQVAGRKAAVGAGRKAGAVGGGAGKSVGQKGGSVAGAKSVAGEERTYDFF